MDAIIMMIAILVILASAAGVSQLSMSALLRLLGAGLTAAARPARRRKLIL